MSDDARDKAPRALNLFIQGLILYSIVTVALETMPTLSSYGLFFRISEVVVVVIFTVEYLAFWALSKDRLRYPFRFMAIVDLLAILPFYLQLGIDLRSLRALRLLRIFRVLKMGRYSKALQTLGEAFQRAAPELAVVGYTVALIILISAMGLYYAEHDAQPEVYTSVPAWSWWAIVTLTTVGYSDVYPVTPVGKIIASAIMLTGIGFIAVPTGLLSSTMTDILRERREKGQGAQNAP